MRRPFLTFLVAGVLLVVPTGAMATQLPPRSTQVTGTLTSNSAFSFMIQTPGNAVGVLNALTSAATRVAASDYPYVWGGGHSQPGIASVGLKGPGYNGKRRGFDCSGSVVAVLVAGGLWPTGTPVPSDAGVIRYLRRAKLIERGAGPGPQEVTLYDDPGVHIFMNIDGRFFGTSDGDRGGDARGGPGWLDDGASDATNPAFKRYHFVAGALKATTTAGYALAFQFGPGVSLLSGYPIGAKVRVVYKTTTAGTMVAQSVTLVGESTVTGTVQPIAPGDSTLTVTTTAGKTLTFPAVAGSALAAELASGQLAAGDTVSVSYIKVSGVVTLIAVTVTATPTPPPTVSSPTPPPPTGGQGV
jgi:hypothetical protein